MTDALRPILNALRYPCREPIHQEAAKALDAIGEPLAAEPAPALDVERLLLEAASSGVEFKMLDRYYVIQIGTETWEAMQEWADTNRARLAAEREK